MLQGGARYEQGRCGGEEEATHRGRSHVGSGCGWEGNTVMLTLLVITPLRRSAIGAGRCIHIGVGAGVDERDLKDHLLVAWHEGHDMTSRCLCA